MHFQSSDAIKISDTIMFAGRCGDEDLNHH